MSDPWYSRAPTNYEKERQVRRSVPAIQVFTERFLEALYDKGVFFSTTGWNFRYIGSTERDDLVTYSILFSTQFVMAGGMNFWETISGVIDVVEEEGPVPVNRIVFEKPQIIELTENERPQDYLVTLLPGPVFIIGTRSTHFVRVGHAPKFAYQLTH